MMFHVFAQLLLAGLASATFMEPIAILEENDPRVVCTPGYEQPFRCVGLDRCKQDISWWSVSDVNYRSGSMLVTDDLERASCQVFFHGTAISLYGLRVDNGASGWYTIDTQMSVKFTWAIENQRLGSGVTTIFRASGLPDGNHTLFMEFLPGPQDPHKGTGRYLASIDFFTVTDPSLPKPPPADDVSPGVYTAHNDFINAGPTNSPVISKPQRVRKCSRGAAIAGSVVACAIGLGVLFTIVRAIKKRRAPPAYSPLKQDDEETVVEDDGHQPLVKQA